MICRSATSWSSRSSRAGRRKCSQRETEIVEEWKDKDFSPRMYRKCVIRDVVYLKEKQERLEKEQKEKEKAFGQCVGFIRRKEEEEEEDEETKQMKEVMGFRGFGSTKKK